MRHRLVYSLLYLLRRFNRLFYTFEEQWVGEVPEEPWTSDYRLVAIINHTSLFEFLYAGLPPDRFMLRMARHGLVPVASKTMDRPFVGKFWRAIAANVVSISRERDHTWAKVLESVDSDSMVIIAPEGRMKRANGLDAFGRPLTIRPGIAELLEALGEGKMLLAYSQGLHHVQIPGQHMPNLFRTLRMRLEEVDVASYCEAMRARGGKFKDVVVDDLTARRDRYCTSDVGEKVAPAAHAGRRRAGAAAARQTPSAAAGAPGF